VVAGREMGKRVRGGVREIQGRRPARILRGDEEGKRGTERTKRRRTEKERETQREVVKIRTKRRKRRKGRERNEKR